MKDLEMIYENMLGHNDPWKNNMYAEKPHLDLQKKKAASEQDAASISIPENILKHVNHILNGSERYIEHAAAIKKLAEQLLKS